MICALSSPPLCLFQWDVFWRQSHLHDWAWRTGQQQQQQCKCPTNLCFQEARDGSSQQGLPIHLLAVNCFSALLSCQWSDHFSQQYFYVWSSSSPLRGPLWGAQVPLYLYQPTYLAHVLLKWFVSGCYLTLLIIHNVGSLAFSVFMVSWVAAEGLVKCALTLYFGSRLQSVCWTLFRYWM